MPDKVELLVDGRRLDRFLSYTVESALYDAADAFSLELSNPNVSVKKGQKFQLLVNDAPAMTGIIERIARGIKKVGGQTLKVGGRDLMGLVVDHYVEEFIDLEGFTLKGLAEKLLAPIPFINRKAVTYGKGHAPADTEGKVTKIDPGDATFDVLSRYAAARGLLFFLEPDGTFVFGKPKERGATEFTIVIRRDGVGNNVEEGEVIEDISKRFSKVLVVGQQQGDEDVDVDDINVSGIAKDSTFPFYKPFVQVMNNDATSPAHLARLTLNQQRAEGLVATYTVSGHSQGGKNWTANSLVRVEDEVGELSGVFLIYNRTFEGPKPKPITRLTIGLPGILQ